MITLELQILGQIAASVGGLGGMFRPILRPERGHFMELVRRLWCEQEGQDIAEYAVMLAVILVIVVGTIRLIGSNANTVFSSVASSIQ